MAPPKVLEAAIKSARLLHPYGYVDVNGVHHYWTAGALIEDAADLALLRDRGVPLVEE